MDTKSLIEKENDNEVQQFFQGLNEFYELLNENENRSSTDVTPLLNALESQNVSLATGTDEECRKSFVRVQIILERYLTLLLKRNQIKNAVCCIHTPSPPTPFCKIPNSELTSSTDSNITFDYERALTVLDRAIYLRLFLESGGIVYAAYTEMGTLEPFRKTEEMEIYNETVEKYKKNLFNIKLNIENFPKDKTGATYFFQLLNNKRMVFGIKSYQANDTQGIHEWGLWLGPSELTVIDRRVDEIINFINEYSEEHKFIKI